MKDNRLAYLNTVLLIAILGYLFVYQKQTGRFIYIPDQRINRPFGVEKQEQMFDTQTGILYTTKGTKWVAVRGISDDKIDTNPQGITLDTFSSNSNYDLIDTLAN